MTDEMAPGEMSARDDAERALAVIRAGLSRFFEEGHSTWTTEQLRSLLPAGVELSHSAVQRELMSWTERGLLSVREEEPRFEVLAVIPASPPS